MEKEKNGDKRVSSEDNRNEGEEIRAAGDQEAEGELQDL